MAPRMAAILVLGSYVMSGPCVEASAGKNAMLKIAENTVNGRGRTNGQC
jgi:hypothetical protein